MGGVAYRRRFSNDPLELSRLRCYPQVFSRSSSKTSKFLKLWCDLSGKP
jgi:hypothetical protein